MLYLAITFYSIDVQLFLKIHKVDESMKFTRMLVNRKTNTYYKDQQVYISQSAPMLNGGSTKDGNQYKRERIC